MVDQKVVESIQRSLQNLERQGIRTSFAVVFGSQVVSPHFDDKVRHEGVNLQWRVAARTDSRIEPVPCGERQWLEDTASTARARIIEIARRKGKMILPAA